MKILIIGGTSFIGFHTAKFMEEQGHLVTIFHRSPSTHIGISRIIHIYGDKESVQDLKCAINTTNPDVIIHMIAMSINDISVLNETLTIKTKVIVISSADAYNAYHLLTSLGIEKIENSPLSEDAPLRKILYPYRGVYDLPFAHDYEKILVEKSALESHKMDAIILRLGMVYGPRDNNHRFASFIKSMSDGENIQLESNYANWICSMVYVENVAQAIALSTQYGESGAVYNVCEKEPVSTYKWISRIGEILQFRGNIQIVEPSGISSLNYAQNFTLSTKKIRDELFYDEAVPLLDGLKNTIDWECSQFQ